MNQFTQHHARNAAHLLAHQNLSANEAERLAYVSAQPLASFVAAQLDLAELEESMDEAIADARAEGHEMGKWEALEADTAARIEELESAVEAHQRTVDAHKALLKNVYALFAGDALKLAAGRKAHAASIRHAARALGVWL